MIFLFGLITGISFSIIFMFVEKLTFKYGKDIVENSSMDSTEIIYPNYTEEVFLKEDSTLEDNLQ